MKNIFGIFVALFFATAAHAQLVLPGAGGSGGGGSPSGSSGDLQTNNGSGGFGSLKTNAALGHGSYRTGWFYGTWPGSVVSGGTTGNNFVSFYPFFVSQTLSVTSLNLYVITGGTGSSAMVGIYADSGGLPSGSSVCTPAASQATTTSSSNVSFSVTCTLTGPAWYWGSTNTAYTGNATMMALGSSASTASSFLGSYLVGESTAALANGNGSAIFPVIGYTAPNTLVSGSMPSIGSLTLSPAVGNIIPHIVLGD